MRNTEDLPETVNTLFEQLHKLNLGLLRCGIGIIDKNKRSAYFWTTSKSEDNMAIQYSGDVSFDMHPLLKGAFDAWLKQDDFEYLLEGDDLIRYYDELRKATNFSGFASMYSRTGQSKQYYFASPFESGIIISFSSEEISAEAKKVVNRFAKLYHFTYSRFLDLKNAEAQARESTIEAALEKVRGKALAMHSSDDLSSTAGLVFTELKKLGINPIRCGVAMIKTKESRYALLYAAMSKTDSDDLALIAEGEVSGHPVFDNSYAAWSAQKEYFPVLKGLLKTEFISEFQTISFPNLRRIKLWL
jgi:hypothetical protein